MDYTKGVFQSLDAIFEVFNMPQVSKYVMQICEYTDQQDEISSINIRVNQKTK